MKKILSSLHNFAHLSSVRGYERIGITTNEVTGISASLAFEVPARPESHAAAGERRGEPPGSRAKARNEADIAIGGQATVKRTFAELN